MGKCKNCNSQVRFKGKSPGCLWVLRDANDEDSCLSFEQRTIRGQLRLAKMVNDGAEQVSGAGDIKLFVKKSGWLRKVSFGYIK